MTVSLRIPDDAYVYTDSDELDTTSAPLINGLGVQTGELGVL